MRLIVYTVVAALVLLAALAIHDPEGLHTYVRYVQRAHEDVVLPFEEISQDWDEDRLRRALPALSFECAAEPAGTTLGDRSCYADIRSFNRLRATGVVFFFQDARVRNAMVYLPSWQHAKLLARLDGELGSPLDTQKRPVDGVRLIGWRLSNGSGLFASLDAPATLLARDALFWVAPDACETSCWTNRRQP